MAVLSLCPNFLPRADGHSAAWRPSSSDVSTPTGDHHQGIRGRQEHMDLRVPGLRVPDLLVPTLAMVDIVDMAGILDHGLEPRVQDPRVRLPGGRLPRN